MDDIKDWIFIIIFGAGVVISVMGKIVSALGQRQQRPQQSSSVPVLKKKKKAAATKKRLTKLEEVFHTLANTTDSDSSKEINKRKSLIEENDVEDVVEYDDPVAESVYQKTPVILSHQKESSLELLKENPRSAVILHEILSPPKGLREDF